PDTAPHAIYTLSLHDALPICRGPRGSAAVALVCRRGARSGPNMRPQRSCIGSATAAARAADPQGADRTRWRRTPPQGAGEVREYASVESMTAEAAEFQAFRRPRWS